MAVEDRAAARLAEIAAMLGCSIDTFSEPRDGTLDIPMTRELLSLWSTIRQPEARTSILDFVRCQAGKPVSAPDAAE